MFFSIKHLTYPLLWVLAALLSFLLADPVGTLYDRLLSIPNMGGGWILNINTEEIIPVVGFLSSYVFFVSILFTFFGGRRKYIAIAVACAPYLLLLFASIAGIIALLGYGFIAAAGCLLALGLRRLRSYAALAFARG